MAWEPVFPDYAGLLPVMQNAKFIIQRDIKDALAWAFGALDPGPEFVRIQYSQHVSAEYPMLVIQPATDAPVRIIGGILQSAVFACEIHVTASIDGDNDPTAQTDTLTETLMRYMDATRLAFLSAPTQDWRRNFAPGNVGKVETWVTNGVYGQLADSEVIDSTYLRSVAFELQLKFTESE